MSVAANRYARALIDVLYPNSAEAGLQQLQSFLTLLTEQPEARTFLGNPTMAGARRSRLLKEISDALSLDRKVSNFVNILADRNRLALLEDIVEQYRKMLDERMGIVRARVTAARPLDALQQQRIGKQARNRSQVNKFEWKSPSIHR